MTDFCPCGLLSDNCLYVRMPRFGFLGHRGDEKCFFLCV